MQVQVKLPTMAEYRDAYARQPVEIVNGEIVPIMAAHGRRHSDIGAVFMLSLGNFVKDHGLGRLVQEASYVLDGDRRRNWVRGARMPDISFISQERITDHNKEITDPDEPWWLAPDIAIEVVSPSDTYDDLSGKVADYLKYGVKLIWMIDPRARAIRVHTPDQPTGFTLAESDTLTAEPIISGWKIGVADLFKS